MQTVEMGGFRLLDRDELTGKETWIRFDDEGRMTVRTVMDVEGILNCNASDQVDNLNRPWGDGAVAARIPMHIWARQLAPAMQQGDDRYIAKWLNDSDHSKLRTRGGRL